MSQGSAFVPTTGTVSGLAMAQATNTAVDAILTCNSGASAPTNASGGVAEKGQLWVDTSVTPNALRQYDGASNWVTLGRIDATNHLFAAPIGGGISTVASATTVDLGAQSTASITISGTTSITSLGSSAVPGTIYVLTFSGSLTLTYNATSLILPGATNIFTQAGDVAVAAYLGSGNWKVIAYTQAAENTFNIPLGGAMLFFGTSPPNSSFVFPYGQAISRTIFSALFVMFSTNFGAGDGLTTFNLPDLRGRVPAGWDAMGGVSASRMTAASGFGGLFSAAGAETETLVASQIPSITSATSGAITVAPTTANKNFPVTVGSVGSEPAPSTGGNNVPTSSAGTADWATASSMSTSGIVSVTSNNTGGAAHVNMQPTMQVNYIMRII